MLDLSEFRAWKLERDCYTPSIRRFAVTRLQCLLETWLGGDVSSYACGPVGLLMGCGVWDMLMDGVW